MANGVLGKIMSSSNVNIVAYTVPSIADFATINIAMVNLGVSDAIVNVAVGTNSVPAPGDYIEHGAVIPANGGILERTCMVCSAGESVIINADSNNVAVRVYGLEKLD